MSGPNWDKLEDLGSEVERLQAEGRWTEEEYQRVLKEALTAADGDAQFVEFVTSDHPIRFKFDSSGRQVRKRPEDFAQ